MAASSSTVATATVRSAAPVNRFLTLKNVVVTMELGRSNLDLPRVAMIVCGRYGAAFPAVVCRCFECDTVISIFSTGRVVIVGCRSQNHGLLSAHMLANTLSSRGGLQCTPYNFNVPNLVYRFELPWKLNLDLIYADANDGHISGVIDDDGSGEGGTSYEPDTFPGIAMPVRLRGDPVMFALFTSGRGIATGLRTQEQEHEANRFLGDFDKYELGNEYRALPAERRHTRRPPVASTTKTPPRRCADVVARFQYRTNEGEQVDLSDVVFDDILEIESAEL